VSLGSLLAVDTEAGGSSLAFSVVGANATQDHVLYIEFFDVGGAPTAGSFDLSQPPDDNYSTCARCLLAFEDLGGASTPYYPASGSLVVTTPDSSFTGFSAGTFQDVVLVESSLESSVTAPVSGGKCWALGGGWEH